VLRNARLFLEDIEKSCAKIILYTEGLTRDRMDAARDSEVKRSLAKEGLQ
jgi:hypothetical protein